MVMFNFQDKCQKCSFYASLILVMGLVLVGFILQITASSEIEQAAYEAQDAADMQEAALKHDTDIDTVQGIVEDLDINDNGISGKNLGRLLVGAGSLGLAGLTVGWGLKTGQNQHYQESCKSKHMSFFIFLGLVIAGILVCGMIGTTKSAVAGLFLSSAMIFSFWAVQHWDAVRPYLYFARMDETYKCPCCKDEPGEKKKRCHVCDGNGCVSAKKYVDFNWQKDHDAKETEDGNDKKPLHVGNITSKDRWEDIYKTDCKQKGRRRLVVLEAIVHAPKY